MDPILSPTPQGFDTLNLQLLGKATNKTFERLAPFCQLENPLPVDAGPAATKVTNKIRSYIQAIDSSILAVEAAYKLSSEVVVLCDLIAVEETEDAGPRVPTTEQQTAYKGLVALANYASEKAENATNVFRQAEQDLFKIAATTKGITAVVQIPTDPAMQKTITKPLKDVGSDLVANLSLLAEFYKHANDLTNWCHWVKAGLISGQSTASSVLPAMDGTEEASHLYNIRTQWSKLHADSLVYYTIVQDLQARYPALLANSIASWKTAMEPKSKENENSSITTPPQKFTQKILSLAHEVVKCLCCHGCFT